MVVTDNCHKTSAFGISADPLTQFAYAFAALIHDVDHQGVLNATLVSEDHDLARTFGNKSVVEQNSINIAWELLMEEHRFSKLRQCIFCDQDEHLRF